MAMAATYVSFGSLTPAIAYKILLIKETSHTVYGQGHQAIISSFEGPTYRIQLPRKYFSQMSPEDIVVIEKDIAEGRNPYVVYREKLLDGSFRLDFIKKRPAYDILYENGTPVPELQELQEDY